MHQTKGGPKKFLLRIGIFVTSSLMLGACGTGGSSPQQASPHDYMSCLRLGLFDSMVALGYGVPTSAWKTIPDAALSATSSAIVREGRKLKVDVPVALSGGATSPVAKDMLAFFRACEALKWDGTGDPAVNGPGVNPSSAPTG